MMARTLPTLRMLPMMVRATRCAALHFAAVWVYVTILSTVLGKLAQRGVAVFFFLIYLGTCVGEAKPQV